MNMTKIQAWKPTPSMASVNSQYHGGVTSDNKGVCRKIKN